jgi:hypothetical protein
MPLSENHPDLTDAQAEQLRMRHHGDHLAEARTAWHEANHAGHGDPQRADEYLRGAHTASLLSIAESLAAVGAATNAATPGVLHTLAVVGKSLQDALRGQTAALQRIADALSPPGEGETDDLDWLASTDGGLRHTAETMRIRIDRIRELVEERRRPGDVLGGEALWPSEILAILDDNPDTHPTDVEWGVQWSVSGSSAAADLRCRRFPTMQQARDWLEAAAATAAPSARVPSARLVFARPGEPWQGLCQPHGRHPHQGMKCLD